MCSLLTCFHVSRSDAPIMSENLPQAGVLGPNCEDLINLFNTLGDALRCITSDQDYHVDLFLELRQPIRVFGVRRTAWIAQGIDIRLLTPFESVVRKITGFPKLFLELLISLVWRG